MLRVIVFLCGVLVILINGFLLLLPRPTLHLMMISEAGSMGIHALLPETGETIRVTTGRSQKKYFSWSPDKKWILFSSHDSGIINLYRKRLNGHRAELLETFPASSFFYAWSPDNEWLVSYFINQNLDKDFYRMRPDGSETTPFQLANMDQILAWPSDWLLATTYNRGVVALYRVHPFEGHIQYLIGDIRDDTFKALAQDGTWLIFESQNRLYRLSLHDAQVSPLLPESAVHHFQGASSEWVVFTGDDQLYRISLHTGQMEFLQDMSGCAFLDFLATSPDNQTMIFWCGYDRLHRLDLVTGRIDLVAKNLPDSGTLYFYNAWSPDSRWVIFSAFKDEVRILYLLDMSTGIFRRLTDSYRSETFITWTPDGEWAILSEYLTRGQTQFSLIRSRPDGSDAQVLSNKPTYFTGWSPPFESDYAGFMPLIRRIFVMCCRRTASALLQRVKSDLPKQCVDQAANGHLSHGQ